MDLNGYQRQAATTAFYPGRGTLQGLTYTALGVAGEAGEVANKVKKLIRDHYDETMTDVQKAMIADELGDVLWYVAMMAYDLGLSLDGLAHGNLVKLADRAERDALRGSGDHR